MKTSIKISAGVALLATALLSYSWLSQKSDRSEESAKNQSKAVDHKLTTFAGANGQPHGRGRSIAENGEASFSGTGSLQDFRRNYQKLLADFDGKELSGQTLSLVQKATEQLALEDLKVFCLEIKNINAYSYGMSLVGARYAKEDPTEGYKWLSELTNDSSAESAFSGFASSLPPTEVGNALKFVGNLANEHLKSSFFTGLMGSADKSGIVQIIQFANNTKYSNPNIMSSISLGLLESGDSQGAFEVCAGLQNKVDRNSAYRGAVMQTLNESPALAAKMISQMPSPQDQCEVVDALVEPWTRDDPEAASKWVGALPAGELRDRASSALVDSILLVNQVDAMNWANSIQEPGRRQREIAKILKFAERGNPAMVQGLKTMAKQ